MWKKKSFSHNWVWKILEKEAILQGQIVMSWNMVSLKMGVFCDLTFYDINLTLNKIKFRINR